MEITLEELQATFEKAGRLKESETNSADRVVAETVYDTLGWVLGHYNNPLKDYD